ncbi:binuclear zinc transcription factor [Histoplasma capsulatum G186AR]|uniref:Binuclear zinc transcription factor n=2 Tax=Ajellomyces capsulatus TaxID=5037 RepID=C0NJK2_AJECG|nr:binuclear zinc transcription factor [Histoplasma capsulatum G186AR]EEH08043.1 binuclear zinc transcription factor [Histoplasma capsulatum G186AR]KAG5299632.1 binuclear zinc transcription factor [Histoplasma capsulatum]QSS67742.1 binuclear zinc transcription factor [Histoplasma capsulatum G186AR]
MDGVNPPPTKLSDARSGELQQGGPSGQDSVAHQSEPPTQIGNDSSPEPRANGANQSTAWVPRPKRIACTICRKRKLRCDGNKPSCGTCSRLGHDCAYDEVRKKSGPKRGYVKLLEARLAQVETLLKSQDSGDVFQKSPVPTDFNPRPPASGSVVNSMTDVFPSSNPTENLRTVPLDLFGDLNSTQINLPDDSITSGGGFSWEMIGLGLEEPLPAQDVIDELNEIYFQKIHPSMPILHRPRYYAAMNLSPNMRPPVCLRYVMWALAASVTDKYRTLHPHFYQRARKYAELDQMRGLGESMITVAHAQTWILLSSYEFRMMFFPRAWISTGHAMRLCMMMGLHRLDGSGPAVKMCLGPARDWTEQEERRRTFWIAFCQDRYASVGTGWPMMMDERDILTNLPASDEAFFNSKMQQTYTLASLTAGENISTLSSLAGLVLIACIFGRNLHHLHRTTPDDTDHDLNGGFWRRHRALDNILLNTSLALPSHLRLPEGINDSSVVFLNLCIHSSTICLHQAAIFKAEKNDMPSQIAAEGKRRSIVAADQITSIMKMASHIDLTLINPFVAFCLYVSCRVFLQYLKCRPDDGSAHSSLQFLLAAMNVLKHKIPLTESFLMQLDADLEALRGSSKSETQKFAFGLRCGEKSPQMNDSCGSLKTIFQEHDLQPPENLAVSSSYEQTTAPPVMSSLPNRSKPSVGSVSASGNDNHTHVVNVGSFSLPTDKHFVKSMAVEMDLSEASTISDRQYLSSDHPTPGTNQSSSSSISPRIIDQPSPPVQQHHKRQQLQRPNPNAYVPDLPPSQFESSLDNNTGTAYANYFTPGNPPPNTAGFENPFAFPAGWNTRATHQPSSASTSAGLVDHIPNLDNITWPGGVDPLPWETYQD